MKVVFPCKGSIVLLKQDLEILKAFYNTSLLTSKLSEFYKNSKSIVQVGNFNYLPSKSVLVLYKANLLTIEKMRDILNLYSNSKTSENDVANSTTSDSQAPISDNDLLSNPFFQTLKPLK